MQAGVGAAAQAVPDQRLAKAGAYTEIGSEVFTGEGEARARPDDRFNAKVGEGIALGRALQDLGKQIEEKWLSRSACEKDVQDRRRGPSMSEAEVQAAVDEGYLQHIEEMRGRSVDSVIGIELTEIEEEFILVLEPPR